MVRRVDLLEALTDAWVESCIGRLLDERHYRDVYRGEDVDVYKPNGQLLFALRPRVIGGVSIDLAYEDLKRAGNKHTTNRPDAAAGKESIRSGTIGYLHGELTYHTTSLGAGYDRIKLLLAEMGRVFAKHRPQEYAVLQKAAPGMGKALIQATAFTTAAVNRTVQMGTHRDDGNISGGYGAMVVVRAGQQQGGLLVFPQYLVAVDVQDGDCLIADNQEAHGNTALSGEEGFERVSVVAYSHSSNQKSSTLDS